MEKLGSGLTASELQIRNSEDGFRDGTGSLDAVHEGWSRALLGNARSRSIFHVVSGPAPWSYSHVCVGSAQQAGILLALLFAFRWPCSFHVVRSHGPPASTTAILHVGGSPCKAARLTVLHGPVAG